MKLFEEGKENSEKLTIFNRFEKRIYIPIPDYEARLDMIKKNIQDTPHMISEKEFQNLAKKADGYSGSDISILVRDAAFEPLRKSQKANTFCKMVEKGKTFYVPVLESEKQNYKSSNLVKLTLEKISSDQLKVPDITYVNFNLKLKFI